ncbi:MAG TPA: PD-(D/E)XK nuclease family protein [Verrucomicrobiales bacterium]|nr:PD-(D/E)XK nuclease family protein [Verrucomicrobiales bacterium]
MEPTACRAASVTFLGWDQPLLQSAAAWLLDDPGPATPIDLSSRLVIVSSRQASRRLRQALAARAAAAGSGLLAPRVVTPEFLLSEVRCPGNAPPPSPVELAALWIRVLRSISFPRYPALFPSPPAKIEFAWLSAVAETLIDLQSLLSEAGLEIRDAARLLRENGVEPERWTDLAHLDAEFADQIDRSGYARPTALRVAAAASGFLPPGIGRVEVVAAPDLPPLAVEALARVAREVPVRIAVFAPEALAAGFDGWGRPLPEFWTHHPLPWSKPEEMIRVHGSSASELAEARALIAKRKGVVAAGIADPELTPELQELLAESGIPAFDPAGQPFRRNAFHHLLQLLRDLAGSASADAVAGLLRIPDSLDSLAVEFGKSGQSFLSARLLTDLDTLRKDHLPESLTGLQHFAQTTSGPELRFALEQVADWRRRLRSPAFPEALRSVLAEICSQRRLDPGRAADQAFSGFASRLSQFLSILERNPRCLEGFNPAEQFSLVLQVFSRESHFGESHDDDLDLSGWLELPWEDAPHLVVTGLHDQRVPETVSSHIYLPDRARKLLGLRHNDDRHARDALLLAGILATRSNRGSVRLSFSQFSFSGDPQKPSRLFFQCPDDKLAARAAHLFQAQPEPGSRGSMAWTRAWNLIPPVLPPEHHLLRTIPVTAFAAYLTCPFRYYLRFGLGMEEYPLGKREMDAREFGILCHDALEGLGSESGLRHCTEARPLRDFLCARAEAWVRKRYGPKPALPVRIQLEAARQRLSQAADLLAEQRREGWVLERVEWKIHAGKPWRIHDMEIRGVIDRLERHDTTGAARILDFKTSVKASPPDAAHIQAAKSAASGSEAPWRLIPSSSGKPPLQWINLQLPLYCLALREHLGLEEPVSCGYFNLPRSVSGSSILLWDGLDEETLRAARRCVEGVIDSIRSGLFWPPAEKVPFEDFDSLFFGSAQDAVAPEHHLLSAL